MALNHFEQALADEGILGTELEPLARSIYHQESSSGKNTKTSSAGARGGMQILPGTFQEVMPGGNIDDPYQNSVAGLRYIKKLHNLSGGDASLTAAGYYGGPGGMEKAKKGVAVGDSKNPNAPTTLEYAKQVTGRANVSRGTSKAIQDNIADLGPGYQAAFALMHMADEPETEKEKTKREEAEDAAHETESAQQFAALKQQLTSVTPQSPFQVAQNKEPVKRAQGSPEQGEQADAQGSSGGLERWIAEKMGIDKAWDISMQVPRDYGYSGDSGTAGDALRHMTLMREISKKYGDTPAKMIGWAHEYIGGPMQYFSSGEPQSSRDREMDLHNNALGLALSRQAKDDLDFIRLAQDAIKNKKADYYREEYRSAEEMPKKTRKRAGGSPEEGEVAEPSLRETAATMMASFKNPEHWKELGAGAKRAAAATPGVLESLGRGAVATVPGTVGDVESLARMLLGNKDKTVAPTTKDILNATEKYRVFNKPEGAEDIEEVGGWISPAGAPASSMVLKGAEKGAEKLGLAATRSITKNPDITAAQMYEAMLGKQTPVTSAVRPKGGLTMIAESAEKPPLSRIDMDLKEAVEGLNRDTEQGKAMYDFIDKKIRKYFQTQHGSPDDPIFTAIVQGRIHPNYIGSPELIARARAGDVAAYNELRSSYDQSLGAGNIYSKKVGTELGKGWHHVHGEEIGNKIKSQIEAQRPGEPVSTWSFVRSIDKEDPVKWPNLYDYPGIHAMNKETESGKLLRLLNQSELPPHLRRGVTEGEPIFYSHSGVNGFNKPIDLTEIKDYLGSRTPAEIKNMGVADVVAKSQEWHEMLEKARRDPSKFSKKQLFSGTQEYLPASNDMKWVDVKTGDALSLEGNIMGHCVGGSNYCNRVNEGTTKILSLRDKKGIPHVTVELAANDKGVFDRIAQIKGTANNPAEKYFTQIDEFLTHYSDKLGEPLRITESPRYIPEKWRN